LVKISAVAAKQLYKNVHDTFSTFTGTTFKAGILACGSMGMPVILGLGFKRELFKRDCNIGEF